MSRVWGFIGFVAFYIGDVFQSNLRVAYDVLTRKHLMKPGIIALDVSDMTDRQTVIMSNLMTMTPGTLSLVVSEDRKTLYLHAMYIDGSPEELAKSLQEDYGRRIRNVF
ncbi:Na+/H+ antiporter subunit E [Rubellicoccus peritrichatus]|uniref:Na+/H+ antiporter subunit E n=1 Tax=Rubellicoccus peritrichatus TaxID=3080537 RepID=A0AAQ3L5M5_9BACT|nr:Na+/H+ antiporter subunit E [Puniceicoccus sp. CR14]WOO39884.1 Na+/H+ antiporter subunit E [Puniceicoccus sp. CR14]